MDWAAYGGFTWDIPHVGSRVDVTSGTAGLSRRRQAARQMPNHHPPVTPLALHPARVFLEPTLTRDGTLDGAWWPHSTDLQRELPALIRILQDRLGPILRV